MRRAHGQDCADGGSLGDRYPKQRGLPPLGFGNRSLSDELHAVVRLGVGISVEQNYVLKRYQHLAWIFLAVGATLFLGEFDALEFFRTLVILHFSWCSFHGAGHPLFMLRFTIHRNSPHMRHSINDLAYGAPVARTCSVGPRLFLVFEP